MKTLTSELQANLILLLKDAWGHVDQRAAEGKAQEVKEALLQLRLDGRTLQSERRALKL